MFKKPFHVKKNVNLRNSDIRKLSNRIPGTNANVLDKKSQVAHVKAITFQEIPINLYLFDKTPLFLDFDEKGVLVPTVYFLWRHPSVYPTLVVHEPVLQYLENGADLMLQGVARSFPVPFFNKGGVVAIGLNCDGKIQPVAIGTSMMSSDEMISKGFQGKGIQIIHVIKDILWEFGPRGSAPLFEVVEVYPPPDVPKRSTDEDNQEQIDVNKTEESTDNISKELASAILNETGEDPENNIPDEPVEHLLLRCFIAGLKYRLTKKGTLPMDVGQFYSQCLLKCIPANHRLDMKKTRYKKFATFLEEMIKHPEGPILRISKKGKGVDLIAEIYWNHPIIRSFEPTDERIKDEEASAVPTKGPTITEYYAITETVLGFFNTTEKVYKGLLLTTTDCRNLITQYVKKENLAEGNGVRLDPILGSFVKTDKPVVDWNTLIQQIQAKMTKTFLLRMPDGRELIKKISMPMLTFKVETRSGNKKVTLLNNLALFGIDVKALCKDIQISMATSATTQDGAVNCEGPQIVVQGNQVGPISEILMTQYGIDKKYMNGLDLAPKKKK